MWQTLSESCWIWTIQLSQELRFASSIYIWGRVSRVSSDSNAFCAKASQMPDQSVKPQEIRGQVDELAATV